MYIDPGNRNKFGKIKYVCGTEFNTMQSIFKYIVFYITFTLPDRVYLPDQRYLAWFESQFHY